MNLKDIRVVKKMKKKFKIGTILISCISIFWAFNCYANGMDEKLMLETIEVTSQKTRTDKQDIPTNVSVFDGNTIEELGLDSIDELSFFVPNLSFNNSDNHAVEFAFRGIGGVTNMNKIWNINLDGVAIPYVNLKNMMDVERVEVLRGSQGALYGRNTHAGVINIITKDPEATQKTQLNTQYESYNNSKFKLIVGGPLNNNLYNLALGYNKEDTHFENKFLDKDDSNDQEQFFGRIKLVNQSPSMGKITLSVTADKYDGGFDTYTLENCTNKTTNDEPGYNDGYLISPTLTLEKNISGYDLTSISNYSKSNYGFLHDWDFSSYDVMKADFDENFNVFTQELRVVKDNGQGFKWMAGGFFLNEDLDTRTKAMYGNDQHYAPPGSFEAQNSTIDTLGSALFGKIVYRFHPKFELTGCLRLDYQKRELNWTGSSSFTPEKTKIEMEESWFAALPMGSLSYIIDKNKRLYASLSRGYKAGDFNNVQLHKEDVENGVDPEYTTTYELGYKALYADKRLELNIAAFYIDWTDMQVEIEVSDSSSQVKKYIKQNAAEAHSMGAEIEARAKLARGWDAFLGIGWLYEAELDEFPNSRQGDLSGKKLPDAKDYKISAGTIYRHINGLFASLDMSINSENYFDEANTAKQGSYNIFNSKIGYEADIFSIYLYGKNLFDEDYYVSYFGPAKMVGNPRTIGVEAKFSF